ncbi:MAG TPA: hypothetical protein VHG89_13755 [Verrucomicrobiae bacterium]|nr:hypothetical protein [Verrucomicrobiae bacterium]
MKTYFLIPAVAGLFLTGCGDSSKPGTAANAVSNVVTAPVNYLGAVVQAQQYAEKTIDVSYINQDIQMFNASEGHYPKDLQEMIPAYLAKIPDLPPGCKLVYDTSTYTVRVVRTNSVAP